MKTALLATAAVVIALLAWTPPASAQHAPDDGKAPDRAAPHDGVGSAGATDAHAAPHDAGHDASHDVGPVPPDRDDTRWVGVVLILIVTLFVLAAVIGPVARAHAPPAEMPPTHSHDEPPGASHHHGSSGTISTDHGDHSRHGDHGHHTHH